MSFLKPYTWTIINDINLIVVGRRRIPLAFLTHFVLLDLFQGAA